MRLTTTTTETLLLSQALLCTLDNKLNNQNLAYVPNSVIIFKIMSDLSDFKRNQIVGVRMVGTSVTMTAQMV